MPTENELREARLAEICAMKKSIDSSLLLLQLEKENLPTIEYNKRQKALCLRINKYKELEQKYKQMYSL